MDVLKKIFFQTKYILWVGFSNTKTVGYRILKTRVVSASLQIVTVVYEHNQRVYQLLVYRIKPKVVKGIFVVSLALTLVTTPLGSRVPNHWQIDQNHTIHRSVHSPNEESVKLSSSTFVNESVQELTPLVANPDVNRFESLEREKSITRSKELGNLKNSARNANYRRK